MIGTTIPWYFLWTPLWTLWWRAVVLPDVFLGVGLFLIFLVLRALLGWSGWWDDEPPHYEYPPQRKPDPERWWQ